VLTSIVVLIVKAARVLPSRCPDRTDPRSAAGFYTARQFEINTRYHTLISPDLDWRKRDINSPSFEPGTDDPRRREGRRRTCTNSVDRRAQPELPADTSTSIRFTAWLGEVFERTGLSVPSGGPGCRSPVHLNFPAAPLIEIMAGDSLLARIDRRAGNRTGRRQRVRSSSNSTERPFNQIAQTVETC